MTVVVGTAGHIDHGKTTLLRALTGIDADRLPEERRRGMTIDVGYAHLDLEDGTSIDFVDVPGHDALIGNMLVGAGEIDAVLLVVAADDGPRAQTLEHLELLDALGLRDGIAVVTKADVAGAGRAAEVASARGGPAGADLACRRPGDRRLGDDRRGDRRRPRGPDPASGPGRRARAAGAPAGPRPAGDRSGVRRSRAGAPW